MLNHYLNKTDDLNVDILLGWHIPLPWFWVWNCGRFSRCFVFFIFIFFMIPFNVSYKFIHIQISYMKMVTLIYCLPEALHIIRVFRRLFISSMSSGGFTCYPLKLFDNRNKNMIISHHYILGLDVSITYLNELSYS